MEYNGIAVKKDRTPILWRSVTFTCDIDVSLKPLKKSFASTFALDKHTVNRFATVCLNLTRLVKKRGNYLKVSLC